MLNQDKTTEILLKNEQRFENEKNQRTQDLIQDLLKAEEVKKR